MLGELRDLARIFIMPVVIDVGWKPVLRKYLVVKVLSD
jgi:hypothetical protein